MCAIRVLSGLVVAFAVLISSAASASPVQLTLGGSILNSNMTAFPVGQNAQVVFTYESSGSPQLISNRQAFYVDHLTGFRLTSGSYDSGVTGTFGQIDLYDNLSNFDGFQAQFAALAATYQYTNPKPQTVSMASVSSNNIVQTFDNLIVNIASNSSSVFSSYDLPTTWNFSQFDQTKNLQVAFSDGGFSVGLTSLIVSSPEPGLAFVSSLMMCPFFLRTPRRREKSSMV